MFKSIKSFITRYKIARLRRMYTQGDADMYAALMRDHALEHAMVEDFYEAKTPEERAEVEQRLLEVFKAIEDKRQLIGVLHPIIGNLFTYRRVR